MSAIDPNTALSPGSQYTISMNQTAGILAPLVVPPSALDVQSQLDNDSSVDLATSITVNSYQQTNGTAYDVTFVYTGDGSDSASDVFQEFANSLEGLLTNWNFLGASSGSSGVAASQGVVSQVQQTASALTPSTGTLWAVAVIGLIAIFVLSGGVGVARSITSAA